MPPVQILLCALFLFSASCALPHQSTPGAASGPAPKSAPAPIPSASAYQQALVGMQQEAHDPEVALASYLSALKEDPDAPFLLLRVAALLTRAGRTSEAIGYAQRAVEKNPNSIEALSMLGSIYAVSKQVDDAIAAYRRVLKLAPKELHPYFTLARLYDMKGQKEKVADTLREAAAAHPDSAEAQHYAGSVAADGGAWDEAVVFYLKALAIDPSLAATRLGLAQAYERQGKSAEAEALYRALLKSEKSREATAELLQLLAKAGRFDEALALLDGLRSASPSDATLLFQTAMVWSEQKEYLRAIETLLPLLAARPDDVRLKSYLASLYEQAEEYPKAVALYEEVLQKERRAYDLRLHLGQLYFHRMKRAEDALAQGEAARAIAPARPEAYLFSGALLHELGRYEESAQVLLRGIDQNTEGVADLQFHLGVTYDKLGRFDDLVAAMERAIALDAQHAVALNYLGYTYADRGIRLDAAIDLIGRALAIRPDDGYIVDSLGWAYYKKGQMQEALTALKKAALLAPEDAAIHEHLGEVYLRSQDPIRAKAAWQEALRLDPANQKLAVRFREAGFGEPALPLLPRPDDPANPAHPD